MNLDRAIAKRLWHCKSYSTGFNAAPMYATDDRVKIYVAQLKRGKSLIKAAVKQALDETHRTKI